MPSSTKTNPTTSVFATSSTNQKDLVKLIDVGLEHMNQDGTIDWKDMPQEARPFNVNDGSLPIGYSRAWLIVRRAYLEVHDPKALVTLPARTADKDASDRAWSKIVSPMRIDQLLSWGEIAVRCGVPESKVRKVFKDTGAKKDLGLRIGKGGRFAYDEPEFYLEHRRKEGAEIPSDLKVRPKVEELLNAKDPKTGKIVRFTRSASGKTTVKKDSKAS